MLNASASYRTSALVAFLLAVPMPALAESTEAVCGSHPKLEDYRNNKNSERFQRLSDTWWECNFREKRRISEESAREYQEEQDRKKAFELIADAARKGRETLTSPVVSKLEENFESGSSSDGVSVGVTAAETLTKGVSSASQANPVARSLTKRNALSAVRVMESAISGFEGALLAANSSSTSSSGWSSNTSYSAQLGPAPQPGGYDAHLEARARQSEYGQLQHRQIQEAERQRQRVEQAEARAYAREERLAAERALTPLQRQMHDYERQQRAAAEASYQAFVARSKSTITARSAPSTATRSSGPCELCRSSRTR